MSPFAENHAKFLMCPPNSLSTREPNNPWMTEYSDEDRAINKSRATQQFQALYRFLAGEAEVYLLPAPEDCGLQDLSFTANLGFVPEHLPDSKRALVANFTSAPRRGESVLGFRIFHSLGYRPLQVPFRFEGEAELKHIHDNVYIGGYGIRSDLRAYDWMEHHFDMRIVKVEETDPFLYHLDCSVFPLDSENTLVCTEMFRSDELVAMEKHTNVISVTADHAYSGICNSVRLHNLILNASHVHDLRAGTEEYAEEVSKNRALEDVAIRLGFEVAYFNLSEFHKSGAMLSCLVMHLNRYSYRMRLL